MLALSYAHRLPADHTMDRIRERITARAPLWDDLAGLAFKAFAIREKGRAGAAANVYASIYLWHDAAAAADMLSNEARFGAVIDGFGRPRVETALPLVVAARGDGAAVHSLVEEQVALGADVDPASLRRAETARVADTLKDPDVLAVVSSLDPANWRLIRTRLLRTPAEAAQDGTAYEVVHLVRPGWAQLTQSRR